MLPHMERAFAEWAPDVVLRDPCEYASAVVAGRLGIPVAEVAISVAEGEAASIGVASPALEEHRRGLVEELWASPYLTRFPAALDPSPFPTTIRFREPVAAVEVPLPDWWHGSQAPLVYVTFGTVLGHMTLAAGVYQTALSAVSGLDARVLLTVGNTFDRADLGPVPPNVHVEAWVDQARVMEPADLVVCHGGSGTVYGALAAGIPVVVVPVFADQFENGRRVAEAGAGLIVEPEHTEDAALRSIISEADAPRITAAVEDARRDPSYRRAAAAIAAEMGATPTVDDVLATILGR